MEAILKFDLPEEKEYFDVAMQGLDWSLAMYELSQWLRINIKNAPEDMNDDTFNTYVIVRDKLFEILEERNLTL